MTIVRTYVVVATCNICGSQLELEFQQKKRLDQILEILKVQNWTRFKGTGFIGDVCDECPVPTPPEKTSVEELVIRRRGPALDQIPGRLPSGGYDPTWIDDSD